MPDGVRSGFAGLCRVQPVEGGVVDRLRWVVAAALGVLMAPASATAASGDWPQYLHGPQHSSVSATTAFTTANAAQAHQLWRFTPGTVAGKPAPLLDAS